MQLNFTEEQEAIFAMRVKSLLLIAYAGAAKTTTLVEYTRRHPDLRFLYLAFNRAIKEEAEKKFPRNVKVLTTHGLAYRAGFANPYKGKLGNPKPYHIASAIGCNMLDAGWALAVVNAWLASADAAIGEVHLKSTDVPKEAAGRVLALARKAWEAMSDPGDSGVPMPHDGYLKRYQLAGIPIKGVDVILFDEFQDTNPVAQELVSRQDCSKIYVGDGYQSIYAFRGAVNAMDRIEVDARMRLTASFRFGKGIAKLASAMLADWRDEHTPVQGRGAHKTVWEVDENAPHAVIARTNAGLFDEAVSVLNRGVPFGFAGGVDGYKFDGILDAYHLSAGLRHLIRDKMIASFEDFALMQAYTEEAQDMETKALVKVVDAYGRAIPGLIERIKAEAVAELAGREIVLATAHKAKGLEWDNVILAEDFVDLEVKRDKSGKEVWPEPEEVNILYVALTRSRKGLRPNASILRWLDQSGRKDLVKWMMADRRRAREAAQSVKAEPAEAASREPANETPAWLVACRRKLEAKQPLDETEMERLAHLLDGLTRVANAPAAS